MQYYSNIKLYYAFLTFSCEHFTVYQEINTFHGNFPCAYMCKPFEAVEQKNRDHWAYTLFPVHKGVSKTFWHLKICTNFCTILYNFSSLGFQVTRKEKEYLPNKGVPFFYSLENKSLKPIEH